MKTRKEILEIIHDSVLEDKIRMEVAICNLDHRKDDDVVDTYLKRSPLGTVEQKLTKKELVKDFKEQIAKRDHALKTIKKLLNEENRQSKNKTEN